MKQHYKVSTHYLTNQAKPRQILSNHLVASKLSQCNCFKSFEGQKYSPVRPVLLSIRSKAHERCLFLMNVRGLKGQEEEGQQGTISFIRVSQLGSLGVLFTVHLIQRM